jgi:hypothetical protein
MRRTAGPEEIPVELSFPSHKAHLAEEVLEEYAFDRLPEAQTAEIEEHLLVCAECREALEAVDEFILLAKVAAAEYQSRPRPRIWSILRGTPGRAVLAASMAALGLVAVISWKAPWQDRQPAQTASVVLSAMRGGDLLGIPHAPAGRPLTLEIDLTGLPAAGTYRVQVVDAAGGPLWETSSEASQGRLRPKVDKGLESGVYWVRLYSQPAGLLREFGLRVD